MLIYPTEKQDAEDSVMFDCRCKKVQSTRNNCSWGLVVVGVMFVVIGGAWLSNDRRASDTTPDTSNTTHQVLQGTDH